MLYQFFDDTLQHIFFQIHKTFPYKYTIHLRAPELKSRITYIAKMLFLHSYIDWLWILINHNFIHTGASKQKKHSSLKILSLGSGIRTRPANGANIDGSLLFTWLSILHFICIYNQIIKWFKMMTIVILFIHMPNVRDGNNTNFDSIKRYWNRSHLCKTTKSLNNSLLYILLSRTKTITNSNSE